MTLIIIYIAGCCQPLTITVSVARAYVRFIDWLGKKIWFVQWLAPRFSMYLEISVFRSLCNLMNPGRLLFSWHCAISSVVSFAARRSAKSIEGLRAISARRVYTFYLWWTEPKLSSHVPPCVQLNSILLSKKFHSILSLPNPRSKHCRNRSLEQVHFWHIDSSICLISALIFTCKHGSSTIKYCSFFILSLCFVFFFPNNKLLFLFTTDYESQTWFSCSLFSLSLPASNG